MDGEVERRCERRIGVLIGAPPDMTAILAEAGVVIAAPCVSLTEIASAAAARERILAYGMLDVAPLLGVVFGVGRGQRDASAARGGSRGAGVTYLPSAFQA
eukprot:2642462-Pleurochrysis_carterae.AAC.1